MTTPTTLEQQRFDAFLLRAKYTYGWLNLESSARRMVEHAVVEIDALTKERDELMAEVVYEKYRKTLWQQLYEGAVEACDRYAKAADTQAAAHKIERDALATAAKLALDALEDCRDVLYQVAHGNPACSDAEGVGSTLPDVFEALKKAGVQ